MKTNKNETNLINELGENLINQLGLDTCLVLSDYFKNKINNIPIFQRKGGKLIKKYEKNNNDDIVNNMFYF